MAFRPKRVAGGDADRAQNSLQKLQNSGLLDESPESPAPTSVAQRFQRARPDNQRDTSSFRESRGASDGRSSAGDQKQNALPTAIKARRLVLEVGAFMSWSADVVAEKEAHANRDPAAVLSEMNKIINDVIRPSRVATATAIRDAAAQDESSVVFAVTSGSERKIYRQPRSDNGQAILHGATLDRVPHTVTPFPPPAQLFPPPAPDAAKPKP